MNKRLSLLILIAGMAVSISSCKKEYHCHAMMDGEEYDFHCEKCTKAQARDYEDELESQGYTDVSCETNH